MLLSSARTRRIHKNRHERKHKTNEWNRWSNQKKKNWIYQNNAKIYNYHNNDDNNNTDNDKYIYNE